MTQSREDLLLDEFPFQQWSLDSHPGLILNRLPFYQTEILPKLIRYCQLQERDPALIKKLEVGFCNGIGIIALNAIALTLADKGGNNLHWFLHCARLLEQLHDEKIKRLSESERRQIESFLSLIENFQNAQSYEAVSQGELQTSLSAAGEAYQQVGKLAGAFTPSDFLKTIDLSKSEKKDSEKKELKSSMPTAKMIDLIAQEKCITLMTSHNHATGFLTTSKYYYYFNANRGFARIPRNEKSALITLINIGNYRKILNEYSWTNLSCPYTFNIVSQHHLDHPLSHPEVVKNIIKRTDLVEKGTLKTEEFKHADQYSPMHMAAWKGDEVSLAAWLEEYKKIGKLKEALNKKMARNLGRPIEDEYKEKDKAPKTAKPAKEDILEYSPLKIAAQRGHTRFVEEFLKNLGDIEPKEISDAFFIAMEYQFLDVAALLVPYVEYDVEAQLIANVYTKQSNLPLPLAAKLNHLPLAQALIIQKAQPTLQDPSDGNTALHIALKQGNVEMFYFLLENMTATKQNFNLANKEGETLLHIAAEKGFEAIVDKIIKIDPSLLTRKDKAGNTPLHSLAKSTNVKLLECTAERKGIDVNVQNNAGETPLLVAAQYGNNAMIKTLLDKHAVNLPDAEGNTLLHHAARSGKAHTVKFLLTEVKADIESKNSQGQTPLFLAVLRGKEQVAKDLIASKATINLMDKAGNSPLHLLSKNSPELIKKIVNEYKLDITQKNKLGESPFFLYIKEKKNDLLNALIEISKIDINAADKDKLTPLQHAHKAQNFEAAKLFIQKGADINIEDEKGQPLAAGEFKANRHELFKTWVERRQRDDFMLVSETEAVVIAGWVNKGLIQISNLVNKEIVLHDGVPFMTWLNAYKEKEAKSMAKPPLIAPSSVSIFAAGKSRTDQTKPGVSEQKHINTLTSPTPSL